MPHVRKPSSTNFQPRMLPFKIDRAIVAPSGRNLDASDSDTSVVIEVGQTLFQPRTHPGLLSGYSLNAACSGAVRANSCNKCALYGVPIAFTTHDKSDYEGKVVTFKMSEAHCIRPYSQYVYFAQKARAVGVLFLSDSKEAHLETLGPATVDFTPEIPSFVVPKGMFSEEYYSWEVQAPPISNGVASESIDSWPPCLPNIR